MSRNVIAPAVLSEAMTWPSRARAVQVYDQFSYGKAAALLLDIKDVRRQIADAYDPHIARAYAMHKLLVKDKKDAEAPLVEAENAIKGALAAYDVEEQQRRLAEQERLRQEAVAIEEQRRLDEVARLKAEAAATGNTGLLQEAMQVMAEPIAIPAIYVAPEMAPVPGIVHRETWKAHVTDLQALIAYVAKRPDLTNLL